MKQGDEANRLRGSYERQRMKQRLVGLFEVEELENQLLEGYQGEGLWLWLLEIRVLPELTVRRYAELEKSLLSQLKIQKSISVVLVGSRTKMAEIQR